MPIADESSNLSKWAEVPIPHLDAQEFLRQQGKLEEHRAKALRDSDRRMAALCEEALKALPDTGYSTLVWDANHAPAWRVFQVNGVSCAELEESSHRFAPSLPFDVDPKIFGTNPDRRQYWRPSKAVRVNDGWLVASNRGEFGAWLDWFSEHGDHAYEISNHQIVDFVEVSGNVMAVEGLAHLGLSRGSLVKLAHAANRWVVEKVATLPAAPRLAISQGKSILIVHGEGLSRSTTSGAIADVVRFPSLGRLYPNSAVVDGQKLYVGMRGYVWEVDLQHEKGRLLAPQSTSEG